MALSYFRGSLREKNKKNNQKAIIKSIKIRTGENNDKFYFFTSNILCS